MFACILRYFAMKGVGKNEILYSCGVNSVMSIYCEMCGSKNEDNANFCNVCGYKFERNISPEPKGQLPDDGSQVSPSIESPHKLPAADVYSPQPSFAANEGIRPTNPEPNTWMNTSQNEGYQNSGWDTRGQRGAWNDPQQYNSGQYHDGPRDPAMYPSPNQPYSDPYIGQPSKSITNSLHSGIVIINYISAVLGFITGIILLLFSPSIAVFIMGSSVLLVYGTRKVSKFDNTGRIIVGGINAVLLILGVIGGFVPGIAVAALTLYTLYMHSQTIKGFSQDSVESEGL